MLKISIKREFLLKTLQLVAGVAEKRQTLPILSHILITIENNKMTMVGTDTEVELSGLLYMENSTNGFAQITLPGKKFLDVCRALPDNSIIELMIDKNRVNVISGRSRFVFNSLPAQDFPCTPNQEKILEFQITQKALRQLIQKTSFAIPQQDVRQYLNGLLVEVKDGMINTLATDGHRLAMDSIALSITDNSFAQVIIPRKGVLELLRLLEDSNDEVLVSLNSNFICIKSNDFILTSKLINGKFPNYNKIIPKRGDKNIEVNCQELKQALTRVGILSNELFRSVRFDLNPGSLVLTTNNPTQEEASEELSIAYQDEKLSSVFNIGYFVDVLNAVGTEKIIISFKNSDSGVIIEESGGNSNCLYVLMPIRQ